MSLQPYYSDTAVTLHAGDCLDVLADLGDASVDAVVTDPPYELGFMGRAWDASGIAYNVEVWRECLRVLKPGGHLVAFGGTRTYHRMTCAIEDAGFEIRDSLHWIYGSGFSKGINVSKAIDKAAGATREVVGQYVSPEGTSGRSNHADRIGTSTRIGGLNDVTAPATDDAKRWEGWNTTLKPAHEPIVLARKPLGGTVAATVLAHGTGALNIDGCRVGTNGATKRSGQAPYPKTDDGREDRSQSWARTGHDKVSVASGRWPANVLLTHPPALDATGDVVGDACADGCVEGCPVAEMDAQSGVRPGGAFPNVQNAQPGAASGSMREGWTGAVAPARKMGDTGGASRFFPVFRYQAKAPKSERPRLADGTSHPTVKPLALMSWLVTLVTPPCGLVLDPFLGSGTTAEACMIEGFRCVGVELDENHLKLTRARLPSAVQPTLT